jgi:hypothetical protein
VARARSPSRASRSGAAEQKYDIELVEGEGRAWRPPVTVLRLLVAAWGDDATVWVGRRVRLYRDPEISFGRDKVGGIRVSHLSHIDRRSASCSPRPEAGVSSTPSTR